MLITSSIAGVSSDTKHYIVTTFKMSVTLKFVFWFPVTESELHKWS